MTRQLMGLKDLLVDAVERTVEMVEDSHTTSSRLVFDTLEQVPPIAGPARLVDALQQLHATTVFSSIKLINRGTSTLIDGGHAWAQRTFWPDDDAAEPPSEPDTSADATPTPMRSDAINTPPWLRDSALGLLNGAFGDHLAVQDNALATSMTLRHDGRELPLERAELARRLPNASGKLCILIHGLACTEWSWCWGADVAQGDPALHYGALLERDLGYTPVFLRYNTGLHISHNGRQLAELLKQLVQSYPHPIEEIMLLGHSMGGLVARSATHYGRDEDWAQKLSRVICLGSPHLGAPLEKASHLLSLVLRHVPLMGTQIPGHLLNARSDGIKDLRFGYIVDEDWQHSQQDAVRDLHRTDIPLLEHASYYFVAATLTQDPEHPLGQLLGDVLVRKPSACGMHREPLRSIPFQRDNGAVTPGLSHLQLSNHPAVYAHIRRWCESR